MKVGDRFGRWVVLELIPHGKNPTAKCLCDCGSIGHPQRGAMRSGKSHSCGCLKREKLLVAARTHGMAQTAEYRIWSNMSDRCRNPKNKHFENYGGRGISVEWLSFDEFYSDMGRRPAGQMIERLDSNGNYSKANCVWAGWDIQSTNKRTSRRWLIHGVEYTSSKLAAEAIGILPCQVNRRCRGYTRNGKKYPPWDGYSSTLLYSAESQRLSAKNNPVTVDAVPGLSTAHI